MAISAYLLRSQESQTQWPSDRKTSRFANITEQGLLKSTNKTCTSKLLWFTGIIIDGGLNVPDGGPVEGNEVQSTIENYEEPQHMACYFNAPPGPASATSET